MKSTENGKLNFRNLLNNIVQHSVPDECSTNISYKYINERGSGVNCERGLRFWGKVNWFNKKKMLRVIMKKHAKP